MKGQIEILLSEHETIRLVLTAFEDQLARFQDARKPDYEILQGSIAYCRECLDRWHHPREDALLVLLELRAPSAAAACQDIEGQHRHLAKASGDLVQLFEAVEQGAFFLREDLVRQGQSLVESYRQHLDWEETHFFPVVSDKLQPEDFCSIAERFADGYDPMAQGPVDRRYRALFEAVESSRS